MLSRGVIEETSDCRKDESRSIENSKDRLSDAYDDARRNNCAGSSRIRSLNNASGDIADIAKNALRKIARLESRYAEAERKAESAAKKAKKQHQQKIAQGIMDAINKPSFDPFGYNNISSIQSQSKFNLQDEYNRAINMKQQQHNQKQLKQLEAQSRVNEQARLRKQQEQRRKLEQQLARQQRINNSATKSKATNTAFIGVDWGKSASVGTSKSRSSNNSTRNSSNNRPLKFHSPYWKKQYGVFPTGSAMTRSISLRDCTIHSLNIDFTFANKILGDINVRTEVKVNKSGECSGGLYAKLAIQHRDNGRIYFYEMKNMISWETFIPDWDEFFKDSSGRYISEKEAKAFYKKVRDNGKVWIHTVALRDESNLW